MSILSTQSRIQIAVYEQYYIMNEDSVQKITHYFLIFTNAVYVS